MDAGAGNENAADAQSVAIPDPPDDSCALAVEYEPCGPDCHPRDPLTCDCAGVPFPVETPGCVVACPVKVSCAALCALRFDLRLAPIGDSRWRAAKRCG